MREKKERTADVAVSAMTQLGDRAAGRPDFTVREFLQDGSGRCALRPEKVVLIKHNSPRRTLPLSETPAVRLAA
jgi:hypothetical protein